MPTDHLPRSEQASQTIARISAAMRDSQAAACLPDLVKIIHALSCEELSVSVQELAELIERDTTVLAKVIGTANTLGYNPGGIPITSVAQAIHVIGFARVRTLAMSLLLLEHAGRTTSAEEQREMATLSLCSGLVAQAIATRAGFFDPDQAFVCASLRNFGRLLLSTFMTEEFRTARRIARMSYEDDDACRTIFGLTPLELGFELLRTAQLPEIILNAVRSAPPKALQHANWPVRDLAAISTFALRLCELVMDTTVSAERFRSQLNALAASHQHELPFLGAEAEEFLRHAEQKLAQFARGAGGGGSYTRIGVERLRRRLRGQDLATTPPVSVPADDHLFTALAEVAKTASREKAIQLALEGIRRAFHADDVLYSARDPALGDFRLEQHVGAFGANLLQRPLFRRDDRNVFGVCISRLENVLIHDATDRRLAPYLPAWLQQATAAPKSFILLPVHHRQAAHALILIGWATPRLITLSPEKTSLLRQLIAQLGNTFPVDGSPREA